MRKGADTDILYEEKVKSSLLAGIDKLADAVKVTLGPEGRNVSMYQKAGLRSAQYSDPAGKGAHVLVTNDGVTIAEGIVLPDPIENMGAQILKEAAEKVNDEAGDGTTTVMVLAQAILHGALRNISAGASWPALKRGMKKAAEEA